MDEIKRIAHPQIFRIANQKEHVMVPLPKNTRTFTIFARTPQRRLRWRYDTPHELYAVDGQYFTILPDERGGQENIFLALDCEIYITTESNDPTVIEVAVYHGV